MRFRALIVLALGVAGLIFSGCSSASSPVSPDSPRPDNSPKQLPAAPGEPLREGHNLLGFWNITVDCENRTWAVVPARLAGMHLNVLTYLEVSPCTNCLTISNLTVLPDKNLQLDVNLKHPFTNPKFTGFDVRGIAMFGGNTNFPAFGLKVSTVYDGNPTLANADGYTTLYNPTTEGNGIEGYLKGKLAPTFAKPTATLNGYMAYYSNENRRYYSAGATLSRTYHIVKPVSLKVFTFGYAVDASWAKPTEPISVPNSFPPTANSLEAYRIDTQLSNPLAMTPGSTATLTIDVYDWQGANTIGAVELEGPYFWEGLKTASPAPGGPGTKRFTCQISNDFGFVDIGQWPVVVRVLDTASQPGALIDYIGWKLVMVPVILNHTPTCAANVSNPEPEPAEIVTFEDASTDIEGPTDIVESWWDWDYDTNPGWDEQGFTVTHSWPAPGIYTVQHMVKDAAGATDMLDEPIVLDVGLYITLQEDLARKETGVVYKYKSRDAAYASGSIINVNDTDGPWDFTTIGLTDLTNSVTVVDDGDPEVASFVGDFNANTTHFVKSVNLYDPFFPVLYQAEYHHFPSNQLYIYGFHDPYVIGSSPFGPPHTPQSLAIPFPLTQATDYSFDINNPGFVLTYQVKAVGAGLCTVPYGGGTTFKVLLVRYKFSVSSAEPVNGGTLNFAFVADNGLVVANVIAVNDPPNINFSPSNSIIGQALFQALNSIE